MPSREGFQQDLFTMQTVNLADFMTPGVHILSGRERGTAIRNALRLEALERTGDAITVVIPKDVIALNSGFVLNLFGESIRRLGRAEFERLYCFDASPGVLEDIEGAKKRA